MQSQMIGMQSSLDRILAAIQQNQSGPPQSSYNREPGPPGMGGNMPPMRGGDMYGSPGAPDGRGGKMFPPLPGFAPPVRI